MSENKRGIALVHEICPICGNPNFILKTNNNVSFCFIEENFGKQIGFFK